MSRKRHSVDDEAHFIVRSAAFVGLHGRAIASHVHAWHQFVYASAGVMTVRTDDGAWIVPPQWALWAPAGVAHGMTFAGRTSLRTLYVRPQEWPELPTRSCVLAVSPLQRELVLRIVEIGMLDRREPVHAAMATLLRDGLREQPVAALDLPMPRSARLRALAALLLEKPDIDMGTDAAARRARLGLRTFERRFQAETGLAFGRWRRQARLVEALRLLAAGQPVKHVAPQCGYRSTSAFVDAFATFFGVTPGHYFDAGRRRP